MDHLSIENRIRSRTPSVLFLDERMALDNEYTEREDLFGDVFTKK